MDQHFPGAVQIVDLCHAPEHLWELAHKLFPNDTAEQQAWMKVHQKRWLQKGEAARMHYPTYREQHHFVGSVVLEAGCKTVMGSRLKQSSMFWTVPGPNAIIASGCCQRNDRFEATGRFAQLEPSSDVAHSLLGWRLKVLEE